MEWVVYEKFEQVGTQLQDVKDAARTDVLVVASFLMPLMYMRMLQYLYLFLVLTVNLKVNQMYHRSRKPTGKARLACMR